MNVAIRSGRVLLLVETIDYDVYRALMTLNDKQSDWPVPNFDFDGAALLP